MSFLGIIKLAFISLGRNKMRSFLTALGIIIGVTSVVGMVALGQGAYFSVQENISKMGTNLIMVMPGGGRQRGFRGPPGSMNTLTPEDGEAIAHMCPSVGKVTPIARNSGQAVFGNQNWSTSVMGVNEHYLDIASREVVRGRFFTPAEVRGGHKVCVIGETVVEELFGNLNPLGQTIRFKKLPLTVIGVLKSRGEASMGGDQDDLMLLPFIVVQRRLLGITHVNMLQISARTAESVESAKEEINQLLMRRHNKKTEDDADFSIHTQDDIAEMAGQTLAIIALLLGSIASVSLLVGGIGIMNIMLVSVTERTREIGIRMAIGAKTTDILYQFLVEAVVLSCVGGVLGIFGGYILSTVIGHFVEFTPIVSNASIVVSILFSGAVGIFFGLYPAWKASQLDPIEAFRYE
ncbi:MAG: ABC-type antimicrobial peptide transport system, permease component [Candidatus Rifleibacterium amylolyticum]|nr:MAG: ABC-type antimicrobial peptide transport system, permease component [Candidatus Rifleibacterium amylolyticum]NLF98253.1 FtsX-like permease family protein [Candidatus Riflebacteria bacterium]